MVWTIEYSDTALAKLRKLDRQNARAIADYMDNRIATFNNPRDFGKALTGSLKGRWRLPGHLFDQV